LGNTPQEGASEGNAADDALLVIRVCKKTLQLQCTDAYDYS